MIVVTCPTCQAASQVADTSRGHQVRCPKCQKPFPVPANAPAFQIAQATILGPAPPPPPAKSPAVMILATCPACKAASQFLETARGQQVRCPQCRQPFPVPAAAKAVQIPQVTILTAPTPVAPPTPPAPRPKVSPAAVQKRPAAPSIPAEPLIAIGSPSARRARSGKKPVPVPLIVGAAALGVLLLVGVGVVLAIVLAPTPAPPTVPPKETAKKKETLVEKEPEKKPLLRPIEKDDIPAVAARIIIPPPGPMKLLVPELREETTFKTLPSPAHDAVIGGGGRYLILLLPEAKKVTVFDTGTAEFVKELAVDFEEKLLIAAGADKLVLVDSVKRTIERYSLPGLVREAEAKLPMQGPPIAIALGSASNGPLVITGVEIPQPPETLFYDVLRLERIELPLDAKAILDTTPTAFLRASADGHVFACQPRTLASNDLQGIILEGGQFKRTIGNGYEPIPGADGQTVFTAQGLENARLKPVWIDGYQSIPAVHGSFYLKFRNDGPGQPRVPREGVPVHLLGTKKPLARLDLQRLEEQKGVFRATLPFDKRVHFIPGAKLIITIPLSGDQLVLRRFDPEVELKKSGYDFLHVVSQPVRTAKRGDTYRYALDVRHHGSDVEYRLELGPADMRISQKGELTWQVPTDVTAQEVDVRIDVRSGELWVRHVYTIYLGPKGS